MKKRNYILMMALLAGMTFCATGCGKDDADKVNDNNRIKSGQADEAKSDGSYDFTISFAGDINLDDNTTTTTYLNSVGGDISKCISPEYIKMMNDADIMCINNEFSYSDRGTPLAGKMYTFRANPDKVAYLNELGVDVANLANNHVYDYGEEAMFDTLDTIKGAGIDVVGAGKNLKEAMTPYYATVDGKTIAIVAASRAEKNKKTPQATEDSPGILLCYDTELFVQEIKEAKENADFVIAFVHWGTEYSTVLEDEQLTTGKEYLDAGADVIVGAHSHCVQGMEYYDGKPIVYSLGNYWFNEKKLYTMLLNLHFEGDDDEGRITVNVVPGTQIDCQTKIAQNDEERRKIFDYLESISINVEIDDDGNVKER